MSIGDIIDSIFGNIQKYDIDGVDMIVNSDNVSIMLACLKNYYGLKIDMTLGYNIGPNMDIKNKIDKLLKLLPNIESKLRGIKNDKINIDKICMDIAAIVIEKMEGINKELIPTIQQVTPLGDVIKLYNDVNQIEKQLLSICSMIKSNFTAPYETIIIERVNKKLITIDGFILDICSKEKYQTELISISYPKFCTRLKEVEQLAKLFNTKGVLLLVSKKVTLWFQQYSAIIEYYMENISGLHASLSNIINIKQDILMIGVSLNINFSQIYEQYNSYEKQIKIKIINIYSKNLADIINKEKFTSNAIGKIIEILKKIYNDVLDSKMNETLWQDINKKFLDDFITILLQPETRLFDQPVIQSLGLFIADLMAAIKDILITKYNCKSPSQVVNDMFKKIKMVIIFASSSQIAEKEIKADFELNQETDLYNKLIILKTKKSLLLHEKIGGQIGGFGGRITTVGAKLFSAMKDNLYEKD